MWKLNEIYAENVCSFRELHYTLSQQVTTLVFGDNQDNESQRSNGSGKSALIECISVGITGSPLRKIKNDEIINDKADECKIYLQLYNDSYDEVFTIERQLFRKGPSIVKCHIVRDGKGVTTDEAVQPSIDGYNKYILEKLGITKEELLNNFILSKYKYRDFLNSSDAEKKEIINRFSNALLVDKALDQIKIDTQPIAEAYHDSELDVTGLDARIEILAEQILREEQSQEEKQKSKNDKVVDIEQSIADKRTTIRYKHKEIECLKTSITEMESMDEKVQEIEKKDLPLLDCLVEIKKLLPAIFLENGTAWDKLIIAKKARIQSLDKELVSWDQELIASDKRLRELTFMQSSLEEEYRVFSEGYTVEIEGYGKQLKVLQVQITSINNQKVQLQNEKRVLSSIIEGIKNKLAGTITCPSCNLEFLASDKSFNVKKAQKELGEKKSKWDSLTYLINTCDEKTEKFEQSDRILKDGKRSLILKSNNWSDKMNKTNHEVSDATYKREVNGHNRSRTQSSITSIQLEIDELRRKIFDEFFGVIDDMCKKDERRIKGLEDEITAMNEAINTQKEAIIDINSNSNKEFLRNLKNALKDYQSKSIVAVERKKELGKSLQELQAQEQIFIQFKSFLANTKIAALAKVTNDFLEAIGSDIRIYIAGFTPLKSGKIREKISISLIRENTNCGSFGKFSAGEAARVNLATILAMRQLINTNCEEAKGLDLLVLDEILEATDESGLANIFQALNRIGVTTLVVSHGNIAEAYPHKLIICKYNQESFINDQTRQL